MDAVIRRRTFLGAVAFGLAGGDAFGAARIQRRELPAKAGWSRKQLDGRRKAERVMRRRGVPEKYRDQIFEGLVYAASRGKRGSKELIDEAGAYLQTCFAEVPDWLKWLATLLSVLSSIVWILLLFI